MNMQLKISFLKISKFDEEFAVNVALDAINSKDPLNLLSVTNALVHSLLTVHDSKDRTSKLNNLLVVVIYTAGKQADEESEGLLFIAAVLLGLLSRSPCNVSPYHALMVNVGHKLKLSLLNIIHANLSCDSKLSSKKKIASLLLDAIHGDEREESQNSHSLTASAPVHPSSPAHLSTPVLISSPAHLSAGVRSLLKNQECMLDKELWQKTVEVLVK